MITDSVTEKLPDSASAEPTAPKPANEVTTDFGAELASSPGRSPSASACTPYRETIEAGLLKGRNAMAIWQDPVDTCGFAAGLFEYHARN